MQAHHHSPSIIAIGDSWFWYPFAGGSLINRLGQLVAPCQHYILAVGNNGAEVHDYVHGKYKDAVSTALNLHGAGTSAVFLSGGGNDFAGLNDLLPLLGVDCSAANAAGDCFKPGDVDGTLGGLMKRATEDYHLLIGQILMKCPGTVKIFVHNYDYALPSGHGIFGHPSDWLRPALDGAKVPLPLQAACTRYIIDEFSKVLKSIETLGGGNVVFIDSRNTLAASDWANEIHPTPAGFRKIADAKWLPPLRKAGLAP